MNSITISGRLTKDPVLRHTASEGTPVCSFTLANYISADKTQFVSCVAWNNTAERISRFLHKGALVAVTGKLNIREWTDKQGNSQKSAEINVMEFVGSERRQVDDGPYFRRSDFNDDNPYEDLNDDETLPF